MSPGWNTDTGVLQKYLDKGYVVVHITSIEKGITDYIIERDKIT